MEKESLTEIMLIDHKKIIELLDEVDKKDHPDIEAFNKFEWHLNKHIFIEEKAIFIEYKPLKESEEYKIFKQLNREHTIIIDLLSKILEESFPKGNINFYKLKKILSNHRKFEEERIYPLLDENLSQSKKLSIVNKISELIQ